MKSEALGAIVGPTMRPEALEAAANLGEDDKMSQNPSNLEKEVCATRTASSC